MNTNSLNQMIGFFMGEGSLKLGLGKQGKEGTPVHIQLAIGLRGDDSDCLFALKDLVGGEVYHYDCPTPLGKISTQSRWCLSKVSEVYSFLLLIQENCDLPFKKMRDIEIGIKFCEWRISKSHFVGDWTFAQKLREELHALHKFEYR